MLFNKKILIYILSIFLFISCSVNNERIIGLNNKYKTEVNVYYSAKIYRTYTFYTENRVDACSFDGTNYLLEKGRKEELLSTTAPIEIIKQSKFDENGIETECEFNYYKK